MLSEQELISRATAGSASAFNELLGAYEKQIFAFLLRNCANYQDAEDLLQITMLRIYKNIGNFRGDSKFSTWCYRIAYNATVDMMRKRKVRPVSSMEEMAESGFDPAAPANDTPEAVSERNDTQQRIRKAVAELPEAMRTVVVLRDMQGLSYEEIAEALDLNIGTVKSRISRARRELAAKLGGNRELFR